MERVIKFCSSVEKLYRNASLDWKKSISSDFWTTSQAYEAHTW